MSVAERLQKTPAQVALRWGIQMGQSVLPKSADRTRIGENFDIFDWSIPHDLMAKFSAIKQACIKTTFFSISFACHWLLAYVCYYFNTGICRRASCK
jgi:alcohol dehydrogenase (NADP+)